MLNISQGEFKSQYLRKKNQIIYYSIKTNNAFNSTFDYTCNQCKEFHIKAEWRKAVGFFQVVKYAVEHNEQCKTVDYKQSGFKRTLPSTKELMQDPHIINGAMVRHLGQSKPRDATQTAQIPQKLRFNISWIAR